MGYWRKAFELAWHTGRLFKVSAALPAVAAALLLALLRGGVASVMQWVENAAILIGACLVFAVVEFLVNLFIKAPPKLYNGAIAEVERLQKETKEQLEPKLEILFEPRYPYDDQRPPGWAANRGPYRLFRIGVRPIGIRTVDDIKVEISVIDPRPTDVFPPLLLQAMQDRSERKTTTLHPRREPWYWDVVDQSEDGGIHIVQITAGAGREIPPDTYALKITAHGRDVPDTSRQFVISVPTPRQGNQDLRFTPADWPSASDG